MLKKILIKNYKVFRNFALDLNSGVNVISLSGTGIALSRFAITGVSGAVAGTTRAGVRAFALFAGRAPTR